MTCTIQALNHNRTGKNHQNGRIQLRYANSSLCQSLGAALRIAPSMDATEYGYGIKLHVPGSGQRQAYPLSELMNSAVGRKLLYPPQPGMLVHLKSAALRSLKTVWRWC